jgi:hypothetical protein
MITANASTMADDLGVAASGDVAIERAFENYACIVVAPRVISPTRIPGGVAVHPHDDLFCALFNNDASDNIPSQHFCLITPEPPFDDVHFDVPTANGATLPNQQVYERSALYRCIATPSTSRRNTIHPFTVAPIARSRAWDFVNLVDPTLQETLHCERLVIGLLLEDDNPLIYNNQDLYD